MHRHLKTGDRSKADGTIHKLSGSVITAFGSLVEWRNIDCPQRRGCRRQHTAGCVKNDKVGQVGKLWVRVVAGCPKMHCSSISWKEKLSPGICWESSEKEVTAGLSLNETAEPWCRNQNPV